MPSTLYEQLEAIMEKEFNSRRTLQNAKDRNISSLAVDELESHWLNDYRDLSYNEGVRDLYLKYA